MFENYCKIAIVDDNRILVDVLAEFLEGHRFDVKGFYGLRDITQLEEAKPDLVLLDLNMPQLSGKEILALMKTSAVLAEVPVILIASDPAAHTSVPAAREIVRKPFRMTDLLGHLNQALALGRIGCQRRESLSLSASSISAERD